MFDGPVARLKKRTHREESYGIQIDAFADMISFGALPVVIGYAAGPHYLSKDYISLGMAIYIGISAMYVLAALIRLAYFNVIEIELQNKKEPRKYYEGLPVTFVAIIIPLVYSICLFQNIPLASVYNIMLACLSAAFVIKVKIPKLRGRQLLIFILIGIPIIVYLLWNIGARM
jgi:CDP-diacylglycerol--serine O-phosphatidyltransferase